MKILNIPGWKNSKKSHWQSEWEADAPSPFRRAEQKDWMFPSRDAWILEIKRTLQRYTDQPVFITAHSIGCIAFVHAVHEFQINVKGALFVAPSDPEQPDYPIGNYRI